MTAFYTITNGATVPGDGYFEIPGNFTAMFVPGFDFLAIDSGSGSPMVSSSYSFTVLSSAYIGGQTQITPDLTGSPTPNLTPTGTWLTLMGGAYSINFSDTAGSPNALTIPVAAINTDTDLGFPGRATLNYGETINENFLHLLENFASPTPPVQPIEGQLWYEKSVGLKVWDGASFISTAGSGLSLPDLIDVDPLVTSGALAGDVLTWTGLIWDSVTPLIDVDDGVAYDEIIVSGSPISPTINTTNVNTTPKTGTTSYQQVFRQGVLQRESLTGSPADGTYMVTGPNKIQFLITLNDNDEILIYQL